MKLNLHPKGTMLLLQAMEEASISKGGIIIPEAHRKQMNQGIVVELGPQASPDWKEGEIVIFPLHSEYRIDQDDTLYLLVEEGQILASDNGEQAKSEGGVESLKLNKFKKAVQSPPLQDQPERRRPIGLENVK